jgi:phosphate-selective porin OprO and OprP
MFRRRLTLLMLACAAAIGGLPSGSAAQPPRFGHSFPVWTHSGRDDSSEADSQQDEQPGGEEGDEPDLKDLDERLKEIEQEWQSHQEELQAEEEAAASKPTVEIGGRIHADYWAYPYTTEGIGFFEHPDPADPQFGTDPEDLFAFRRVRLEMEGDILENMLWRIQVDFNNPQTPEFKDVYIGFDELPNNQELLVGIQKRPLGLDHLNSSRYNVFLERPLVIEAFNEDARRPGIAMYGHTDDESVGWIYGAYLLENITTDGRVFGDHYQPSLNGRLWSSPWYDESSGGRGYFHWGIAGMVANPDGNRNDRATNANEARFRTRPEARTMSRWLNTGRIDGAQHYEVLGLEALLNIGAVQIVSEYQANWLQRHHSSPQEDLFFQGAYVYVSYFLTGEHIPYDRTSGTIDRVRPFENFFLVERCCGGRGHGWGAWNVALRYDWLDLTEHDITGGVEHNGTLAVNWFFNAYAKLQFNLIYGTIDQRGPVGGFDNGEYLIAGTRLAIEF